MFLDLSLIDVSTRDKSTRDKLASSEYPKQLANKYTVQSSRSNICEGLYNALLSLRKCEHVNDTELLVLFLIIQKT